MNAIGRHSRQLEVDETTRRAMIELELAGVGRREIARELKLPSAVVERTLRYARYHSPPGRRWSDEILLEIEQMIADGKSYEQIQSAFSMTRDDLDRLRKHYGLLSHYEAGWRTFHETCQLLGVHKRILDEWIRQGAIPAIRHHHRGPSPQCRQFINIASIVRFLRKRAYWDEWRPGQISDPTLRRIATVIRATG